MKLLYFSCIKLVYDYKKYIVFFVPAIFFLRFIHTYEKLFPRHSNHQVIGVNSVVIGLFS